MRLAILLLPLAACTADAADRPRQDAATRDAAAVQRELAGLVPGATTDCLPTFRSPQSQSYGDTIIFTVSRGLKYRTQTNGRCGGIGRDDVLVTRTTIGRLCRGDIAITYDRASQVQSGSCAFGDFTEYRRP